MRAEIKAISAVLLLLILVALIYYFPSLAGFYNIRFATWEEDAFKGKPLRDLQLFLQKKDIYIGGADPARVFREGPELLPNQKIYSFTKGSDYRIFPLGTAVNVGYVIVEKRQEGEIVIDVRRGRSVDSL